MKARAARLRGALRPLFLLAVTGGATLTAAFHGAGCQATTTPVATRSLDATGRVSFVCLGSPADDTVEQPLDNCSSQQFVGVNDYNDIVDDAGDVDAGARRPHLYALVTQPNRGEIAVIDTSSTVNQVLDQNSVEPGANLIPVGGMPSAVVSTPGSVASFVAVSEVGRAGIFALPSNQIRPGSTVPDAGTGGAASDAGSDFQSAIPQLSSWPACSLPATPGDMILVADPPSADPLQPDWVRPTCDEDYAATTTDDRITTLERKGRQKIVVTMPDYGGIAIIDAETVLQQAPGAFAPCPVERWVPLQVDLTGFATPEPPPAPPPGTACVQPVVPQPAFKSSYTPRPGGISYAAGTLYVADLAAPVIHVIDMPTVCEPVERAPLMPYSAENPKRVVFSSKVSVAPQPNPELKRYLYATDLEDGSLMWFDVSPTSTTRRPLQRQHPEWNPFQPIDRMRFAAPVADILVLQNDVREPNPATGIAAEGVRCNPDPGALVCTATSPVCDLGANYQTDRTTYTSGAGPRKLRGTFAFAALTSGKVAVVDIDDFDGACRAPAVQSTLYGCAKNGSSTDAVPNTTLEKSCNVIEPNAVRSSAYDLADDTNSIYGVASIIAWPQLFNKDGQSVDYGGGPVMIQPPVPAGVPVVTQNVGDAGTRLDCAGCEVFGAADDPNLHHELRVNYEEPRVHVAAQDFAIAFEGAIGGFEQRLAELSVDPSTGKPAGIYDSASRFCDSGVLGEKAMREIYGATMPDASDLDWARYADYVQVTSALPDELDPYWVRLKEAKAGTDDALCKVPHVNGTSAITFGDCLDEFGTLDTPSAARDLRIVEAYQDHVEITPRPQACAVAATDNGTQVSCPEQPDDPGLDRLRRLRCCFPGALAFTVRVGGQWIVQGSQSGFIHHVVADPATGACRNSCQAIDQRKNGRVLELPESATVDDARIFINPMFSFALVAPLASTLTPPATSDSCAACGAGQACFAAQCTPPTAGQSCPAAHLCAAPAACLRPDGSACNDAADCTCACPAGLHTTPYCGEAFAPTSATWRYVERDSVFRFSMTNAFSPLLVSLASDTTTLVAPQALHYLHPTGELVVTDGSLNGLIFVSLSSSTFSRSYF